MSFLYAERLLHVRVFRVAHAVPAVHAAAAAVLQAQQDVAHAIPAIRHLKAPQTINNVLKKVYRLYVDGSKIKKIFKHKKEERI